MLTREQTALLSKLLESTADWAICLNGELHTLHLNMVGCEFDTLHKEVLKEYYEEAENDYDEFNEKLRMFGGTSPAKAEAACRLNFQVTPGGLVDKAKATLMVDTLLQEYCKILSEGYKAFNGLDEDGRCIGVANYYQTRLEYWTKEFYYFNKSRMGADV